MTDKNQQQSIEKLLFHAALGSPAKVKDFLIALREAEVWVIERFQEKPLSDAPEYPNEFFNVLGIRHSDKTVVPVFTRAELCGLWSGLDLKCRALTFCDLATMLPDDWWLLLNAGQEIEKELSPWEISKIAEGADGLQEALEDVVAHFESEQLEIIPLATNEFADLILQLKTIGNENSSIQKIFIAKNMVESETEHQNTQIIAGIVLDSSSEETNIKEQARNAFNLAQLLPGEYRLLITKPEDLLQIKLLESFQCIYQKQKDTFWQRLKVLFTMLLRSQQAK